MKVLVTGGCGFIGAHLVRKLRSAGHEVTVTSRTQYNTGIVKADLSLPVSGLTKGYDCIFHLSADVSVQNALENPVSTLQSNTLSTVNLLEDMRRNNVEGRFILLSTDRVYGKQEARRVKEDAPCSPVDIYGLSKHFSEQACVLYHESYGINYTIIRSGNAFGPGQRPGLFIPSIITQLISKDEIAVGNLTPVRNFIFVDDLVKAMVAAGTTKTNSRIFNLATERASMQEVLDELCSLAESKLHKKVKITVDSRLKRPARVEQNGFELDCDRAIKELHFKPSHTLKQGLAKTFEAFVEGAHASNLS